MAPLFLTVLRTVFTIPKNIIQEALRILNRSIILRYVKILFAMSCFIKSAVDIYLNFVFDGFCCRLLYTKLHDLYNQRCLAILL